MVERPRTEATERSVDVLSITGGLDVLTGRSRMLKREGPYLLDRLELVT